MFLPMFRGEQVLPLDSDSFFDYLTRVTNRMGRSGAYVFSRISSSTARISSNRINPFGYTFNDAVFVVESRSEGDICVRYRVSFVKWFLAMLFLSFQVLIAFAILLFFYIRRLPPDIQGTAFVAFFVALTFWALLWPLIMIAIYRLMLSRMFRILVQSAALFKGISHLKIK